jgi:hypothetical protein
MEEMNGKQAPVLYLELRNQVLDPPKLSKYLKSDNNTNKLLIYLYRELCVVVNTNFQYIFYDCAQPGSHINMNMTCRSHILVNFLNKI